MPSLERAAANGVTVLTALSWRIPSQPVSLCIHTHTHTHTCVHTSLHHLFIVHKITHNLLDTESHITWLLKLLLYQTFLTKHPTTQSTN
jgi:hypothetical protein